MRLRCKIVPTVADVSCHHADKPGSGKAIARAVQGPSPHCTVDNERLLATAKLPDTVGRNLHRKTVSEIQEENGGNQVETRAKPLRVGGSGVRWISINQL